MKTTAAATALAFLLGGCATASRDVATTYVSPMQYQSYDCDQLAAESQRIGARAQQVGGRLDEAASNDKAITAAGAILFWPALFFLGGTKQQEAEFARLKGESEAVQQAAVLKRCTGALPSAQPKQVVAPVQQPVVAPGQATCMLRTDGKTCL